MRLVWVLHGIVAVVFGALFGVAAIWWVAVGRWVLSGRLGVVRWGGGGLGEVVLGLGGAREVGRRTGSGGFGAGWRGGVDGHAVHEVAEAVALAVGLAGGGGGFGALDGAEQLGAFFPAVVDEDFDVFAQRVDAFFHFRVEALRAHQAVDEVVEGLEDFAVAGQDGVALAREGFVFGLFGADALVLQEVAVVAGEVFEEGGLFVVGLEEPVLVGAEFFEFGFEELVFVVGYGFFVQDEDVGDVVVFHL